MCDGEKVSYALRSRTCKRKHTDDVNPARKRLRSFDHMSTLPNEMLLHIFSYLDVKDLYFNVRGVCQRWSQLAMLPSSWKSITVDNDVPTEVLLNWIRSSPVSCKHLKISNRVDIDIILEAVSKHARQLETLTIENGEIEQVAIRSVTLCNLITRCEKLEKIIFEKVKIRSCKFFKLLADKKNEGQFKQLHYVGPVTPDQQNIIRQSWPGLIIIESFESVQLN